MSQIDPAVPNEPNDPNAPDAQIPAPAPAPKPKKKHRLLKVLGVLLVLLVLLVVFAPWIASTAPVRGIVVSQINKNLNGSVAIDDYSVGWTGGINANGIKVYDQQKNLVVSVPRVSTQLSLLSAIRGNLNLGDTVVDVKLDKIVVDKDGNVNLASLAKPSPAKESKPKKKPGVRENEIELPKISGKLTVNLLGGAVEGEGVPAPIVIDPSTIVLNFPDINQPITNDIKLAYRVGNSAASAISMNGTVTAVENGKLDLDRIKSTLKAQQKLALDNVDLAAASPMMKKSLGPDADVAGIVRGGLDVNVEGITGISAKGLIEATNVAFAGAGLKDRLELKTVSIPIQVTRTVVDANTTLIKIEKLSVNSPLVNVTISGQVPEQALNNVAAKKPPGAAGQINIDLVVPDLGAVARAMPNTLKLQEGASIDSGSLTNSQTIVFANDSIAVNQKLDLVAKGKQNGKEIQISPVHLETAAVVLPNGKDVPDVRKLRLVLTSAFATVTGGGDSIAKVGIDGNFDLAKLQNELRFLDLGGRQFSGTGQFKVATDGDPTTTDAPITASANVNLANIRVIGVASQPIDLARVALTSGGQLQRDKSGKPQAVNNGTLNFQSGDEKSPLVNVVANANIAGLSSGTITAPSFKLAKFEVNNLEEVQRQFGALLPALKEQGIELKSGAIYANVAGKFDGKTVTLDEPLGFSMPNLVVNKGGKQVLGREDISGKIGGSVALGDAINANLSELSVSAKSGLFSIASDAPVNVTLAKSGGVAGNGVIKIGADLARLSSIAQAFGGAVEATNSAGQVTSGKLDGTLRLAQAKDTSINFDGKVLNLSVSANGQQPIKNETVTITLDATATGDMKGVNVKSANVASTFANAKVSDAQLALGGAPLEIVKKANVDVDVPNLPAVYGLMNAFAPPTAKPQAAVEQSIGHPTLLLAMQRKKREAAPVDAPVANTEPIAITNGSARLKLTVDRADGAAQTNVNLSEMKVSKLQLARGKQTYAFDKDIDLKLAASLANKGDQVESITVNELSGDLGGVATIAMPEKLSVTSPQDKPQANGAIKLDGTIDALAPLLAVLQGAEPLPYSGQYSLTQKVATSRAGGNVVSLVGNLSVPKFVMKDGKNVQFEDAIELTNDLSANLDTETATIKTLSITMPRSNALAVNATGSVEGWNRARRINGVKVDLTYDLATLWKLAAPTLPPDMREQYKDLKVAGKSTRTFNVSGAFPKKDTVYQSFKSLNADGSIGVELLDLPQGVTAQMVDLPFKIAGGVLTTQAGRVGPRPPTPEDSNDGKANGSGLAGTQGGSRRNAADDRRDDRAKPAAQTELKPENGYANTGALNLAGITIDLTTSNLNVTIPKDKLLLQQVRLNPVLADSLGKIGAVLFVGSSTAEGLINLRVAQFNRVPIGDLTSRDRHANATLVLNVEDVKLSGIVTSVLAQALGADAITGRIPDSTISIASGQARTNLTVLIDKEVDDAKTGRKVLQGQPLKFNGAVNLADLRLQDFVVDIAPGLLIRDLRKYAPNGAVIPLRGFATKPQLDIQKFIAENAVKGLIPGNDGDGKGPNIGDILGGLGGDKKDSDKKKKDKKR